VKVLESALMDLRRRVLLSLASFLLLGVPLLARPCAPPGIPAEILLPKKVIAGQPASLAVIDGDGALLAAARVEFSGGEHVVTDSTGRATFVVPELPSGSRSGILSLSLPGGAVKETTLVLPPMESPPGVQIGDISYVIAAQDRFHVTGAGFRGEVDGTRAWLRGKPALVVAASPVALVILPPPGLEPGPAEFLLEAAGARAEPVTLTLVALEITAKKSALAPKEKGKLRIGVRGSGQRLELEVRNLTPELVSLEDDAEAVRVRTRGGSNNYAEVNLLGKAPGEFSVSARLLPALAGVPNLEIARQKLLAARKLAQGSWRGRVESVIRLIETSPQETTRIRNEIEKLLGRNPQGEFGRLLEEAWRIFLRR
jgi:hypothetical protein